MNRKMVGVPVYAKNTRKLTVRAYLMAPAASFWLRSASGIKILNVFPDVCNLISNDGDILSIVFPTVGPGPFSIVLDTDGPASQPRMSLSHHIDVNSTVYLSGGNLHIGTVYVNTFGAVLWQAKPEWQAVQPELLSKYLPVVTEQLGIFAPLTSLASLVIGGNERPWPAIAAREWSILREGLVKEDLERCARGAAGLAGLGIGLTPAGDDFLLGIIYALWVTRQPQEAAILVNAIVAASASRTTSLSAAWLRAAGRAEAGWAWHRFVRGVSADDPVAVGKAICQILSTGHTSGADALAGFIAAVKAEK